MVTAVWMLVCGFIVLVSTIFVGAAIHHHWRTWADKKRAELEGDQ